MDASGRSLDSSESGPIHIRSPSCASETHVNSVAKMPASWCSSPDWQHRVARIPRPFARKRTPVATPIESKGVETKDQPQVDGTPRELSALSTEELASSLPPAISAQFLARLQAAETQQKRLEEQALQCELSAQAAGRRCGIYAFLALLWILAMRAAISAIPEAQTPNLPKRARHAEGAASCFNQVAAMRANIAALEQEVQDRGHLQALTSIIQWGTEDLSEARVSTALDTVPERIRFHVGEGGKRAERASGVYERLPTVANSQPVWQKVNGSFYLYSGLSGFWYVGDEAVAKADFRTNRGYFHSGKRHDGLMPDRVQSTWRSWNGTSWIRNPNISLTALGAAGAALPESVSARECAQQQAGLQAFANNLSKHLMVVQAQELKWQSLSQRLFYDGVSNGSCSLPHLEFAERRSDRSCSGASATELPAWRRGSALPLCTALTLAEGDAVDVREAAPKHA